jgi:CTP:molybdopterin cytidylyltransferase MocA
VIRDVSLAAVVLAAGRGARFGGEIPKPVLVWRGRALVAYALDAATESGCKPVVLVASDDRVIAVALPDTIVARNPDPARGIASSLQCALAALDQRADVGAVIVGLGDQPLVGAEAYRRLAAAYNAGTRLAVATYAGVRANPVLIAREYWPQAVALDGDEGARVLFRHHDVVEVPCDGTGDPTDVDTPEDLAALESRWRSATASE